MAKYVDILFRHRMRFLLLFVALPLELASACIFLFPHETAVSSLWVDSPAPYLPTTATGWNQYLTPAQNTQNTLNQLTNTGVFESTMAQRLDKLGTFRDRDERDNTLGSLATDLHVTVAGSNLVLLNFTCTRSQICIDVLSTTFAIYHDWLFQQIQNESTAAKDLYSGQLLDAQSQYSADAQLVTDYQRNHPRETPADLLYDTTYQQLLHTQNLDEAAVTALKGKIQSIDLTTSAAQKIYDTILKPMDSPRMAGGRLSALPRKQMIIAGLAGLGIAMAVLVIMAFLDRTIREPGEIEHRLKLPVVTTIADLASRSDAAA